MAGQGLVGEYLDHGKTPTAGGRFSVSSGAAGTQKAVEYLPAPHGTAGRARHGTAGLAGRMAWHRWHGTAGEAKAPLPPRHANATQTRHSKGK
jgi:hypothetical protein